MECVIWGQRWQIEVVGGERFSCLGAGSFKDMDDVSYDMSDSGDCISKILHSGVASLALATM